MPSVDEPIDMTTDAEGRRFVKALVKTGTIAGAAEAIGVSERTGRRMAKRPGILRTYQAALAKAGIDDDAIAQVIANAMHSTKPLMVPDGSGGVRLEFIPDHRTRLMAVDQATETAMKLRALEKDQAQDDVNTELPENIDSMTTEEISALLVRRVIKRRA